MPEFDLVKRRKVMKRSMKLGHCICDPKKPCPCDTFINKGLCPCAGDRPDPIGKDKVKLTELVHNAGCASKISASDLERFLSRLPDSGDPNVLSGITHGDDAGIYKLSDDVSLVQTVDIFTPCVDDAYLFGKICAANCLSDIYAMGGEPKTALSVLAFPVETLDGDIMFQMMNGATEVFNSIGCSLIGGHSIKDEEIKLGFAITGLIDHKKAAELENAQEGDVIILTKKLGVGVLNYSHQINRISTDDMAQAIDSMVMLNKNAADAMIEVGVSACTDITGFGLFGHLIRMMHKAGVTARIYAENLPVFDKVLDLYREEVIPGAIERNSEFVGEDLLVGEGVDEVYKYLGFDAQTSGGLMLTVSEEKLDNLIGALKERETEAYIIGKITEKSDGFIELVKNENSLDNLTDKAKEITRQSLPDR